MRGSSGCLLETDVIYLSFIAKGTFFIFISNKKRKKTFSPWLEIIFVGTQYLNGNLILTMKQLSECLKQKNLANAGL